MSHSGYHAFECTPGRKHANNLGRLRDLSRKAPGGRPPRRPYLMAGRGLTASCSPQPGRIERLMLEALAACSRGCVATSPTPSRWRIS
ncbi:hypothetical protein SKAU_G00005330 [Synaphobranchus kaupii]|uniref:Uncharacterized protein n=1 Tax=Synaphobranchus kaupii TaxID=118154 RepID=A0A9Q1JCF0_SYNKA|nr:hypothetical protein SKAU_G00005330 [Synaphobranchus kaupii]